MGSGLTSKSKVACAMGSLFFQNCKDKQINNTFKVKCAFDILDACRQLVWFDLLDDLHSNQGKPFMPNEFLRISKPCYLTGAFVIR